MQPGLLLFAHGAREPAWARPFEAVAERIRAHAAMVGTPVQIRLAFLEFMQPGLLEAATSLVEAGCERVDVVPLFLGSGGHVRKDLPALLDTLRAQHPAIEWLLRPAIGEANAVIDAMADVAWQGLETGGPAIPQATDSVTRPSR